MYVFTSLWWLRYYIPFELKLLFSFWINDSWKNLGEINQSEIRCHRQLGFEEAVRWNYFYRLILSSRKNYSKLPVLSSNLSLSASNFLITRHPQKRRFSKIKIYFTVSYVNYIFAHSGSNTSTNQTMTLSSKRMPKYSYFLILKENWFKNMTQTMFFTYGFCMFCLLSLTSVPAGILQVLLVLILFCFVRVNSWVLDEDILFFSSGLQGATVHCHSTTVVEVQVEKVVSVLVHPRSLSSYLVESSREREEMLSLAIESRVSRALDRHSPHTVTLVQYIIITCEQQGTSTAPLQNLPWLRLCPFPQ